MILFLPKARRSTQSPALTHRPKIINFGESAPQGKNFVCPFGIVKNRCLFNHYPTQDSNSISIARTNDEGNSNVSPIPVGTFESMMIFQNSFSPRGGICDGSLQRDRSPKKNSHDTWTSTINEDVLPILKMGDFFPLPTMWVPFPAVSLFADLFPEVGKPWPLWLGFSVLRASGFDHCAGHQGRRTLWLRFV